MEENTKYNLKVITADLYKASPQRYELRKGNVEGAPLCPFGNQFEWIGYDLEDQVYVRMTKSVFKKMIKPK